MSQNQLPPTTRARTEAINDEVNELHPLLERLFRAMPFNRVEYTHGTNEMGADFVLTAINQFLNAEEYIGIVAKTKRILQNTDDVERQIKECRIKRLIEGGVKEVHISEVWVITTKTISDNAKRKINDEFSGTNVKFVDGEQLASLIQKHIPDFWHDIPIDVGAYLAGIRVSNEEIDRRFSLLTSVDIGYIEQDIVRVEDEYYGGRRRKQASRRKRVELKQEIDSQKFIFLEGGVGSGKSKLLRNAVSYYADPEIYKSKHIIPIILTFKDFYDQYGCSITRTIAAKVTDKFSRIELEENTILLLIDGFDEKILTYEDRIEILTSFKKELDGLPYVRAVVASRQLFSVVTPPNALKQASRYEVNQLSFKRIIEFIDKICKQINLKSRLLEDLKKSSLMRDLPKSPVAAILLGQLLQENGQDLPSNITELYSKYIEFVLGRWEIQKGLQSQRDYEIVENVLMEVARFMLDNQLNIISPSDLRELIKKYCNQRNLGVSIEEIYNLLRERNEVLVVHESSGQVAFKHRSFAEFLYGKYWVRSQNYKADKDAFRGHPGNWRRRMRMQASWTKARKFWALYSSRVRTRRKDVSQAMVRSMVQRLL